MKEYTFAFILLVFLTGFVISYFFRRQYKERVDYLESHNDYLTREYQSFKDKYYDTESKYLGLLANKQEVLIEGLEGVTSVSVSALKYVELLSKEKELLELKMKLKDMQ
jgi:hypothetical protein